MMVALAIGLVIVGAVISVYLAQSQVSKSSNAQASIQSAENAIASLVVPTVRGAGFMGCGNVSTAISNLVTGGPAPLGALGTTNAALTGYDYTGTSGFGTTGNGTSLTIASLNAANSGSAANWNPSLDATLVNHVIPGSDVLVVFGPAPGSQPTGVTALTTGSSVAVISNTGFAVNGIAAMSDCLKSSVFQVTGSAATSLTHAVSAVTMGNATAALSGGYQPGAQVVPMQQTAFFVSQDTNGGQSVLTRATLVVDPTTGPGWTFEPLVPGVETMQALYGVKSGASPQVVQYFAADTVADWTQVISVRLAFLIEGQAGSKASGAASAAMLGTTVTPPSDALLRHVYEVTINLRNSS